MKVIDRKQRRLYLLAITVDKRAARTTRRTPTVDMEIDYMAQFNVPTGEDDATQARLDQNAALYG